METDRRQDRRQGQETAMKRKSKTRPSACQKRVKRPDPALSPFRPGLLDKSVRDSYATQYAKATPYRHAVIPNLVNDSLLRSVRREIRNNVDFAPKETDIYKIHQSGDLANLDGLDDESLARLPSLLALRDAIYSETFRNYICAITGCGPLSGRKTDMAINVYTPGCHLLCHDDVIGSRRVSYILYLTDPEKPWQPEWGGALRLYATRKMENNNGQIAKTPLPDVVKVIPPAWNQLSFFAVQPGESFHDVQEVYYAETNQQLQADGGRIRMAISGWFHLPQEDENGYVQGEEERNAKNSGLMQLQGNPDQYDTPQPRLVTVTDPTSVLDEFDEADLEFLLRFISPTYLTPDTLEQVSEHFEESSSITLANILSKKFAKRLKDYVTEQEMLPLPHHTTEIESKTTWTVATPPHKHKYLYQSLAKPNQPRAQQDESPLAELMGTLLPSPQFRHWLFLATKCTIRGHDILARRFRRGLDYTLATGHSGKPRLEVNIGITPTPGWGDDDDNDENQGKNRVSAKDQTKTQQAADGVGGHEVFMAGDDDASEDAAIYKSSSDDDDNILFYQAAAWNKMTIVLRDRGTLKFVKYISQRAKGDRWDVCAEYHIEDLEEDENGMDGNSNAEASDASSDEEFKGFSDSVDSGSE
ncbi:hypothetical protein CDD82_253 [Ophiocordyceps australis]|uniref:uS12 prolyl 3,4-dihydroxylase n=1 Tax=Ophiocordyceps australis TaxID=1399860 RepID=A0A2C5ZQG4_9HYPO|nr:hypothetical protein CDD82_253 [Ophiocordyceps australis]